MKPVAIENSRNFNKTKPPRVSCQPDLATRLKSIENDLLALASQFGNPSGVHVRMLSSKEKSEAFKNIETGVISYYDASSAPVFSEIETLLTKNEHKEQDTINTEKKDSTEFVIGQHTTKNENNSGPKFVKLFTKLHSGKSYVEYGSHEEAQEAGHLKNMCIFV